MIICESTVSCESRDFLPYLKNTKITRGHLSGSDSLQTTITMTNCISEYDKDFREKLADLLEEAKRKELAVVSDETIKFIRSSVGYFEDFETFYKP